MTREVKIDLLISGDLLGSLTWRQLSEDRLNHGSVEIDGISEAAERLIDDELRRGGVVFLASGQVSQAPNRIDWLIGLADRWALRGTLAIDEVVVDRSILDLIPIPDQASDPDAVY